MIYKDLNFKVKRNSYGDYVLIAKNAMVVCDEINERSLEKLYKTHKKVNNRKCYNNHNMEQLIYLTTNKYKLREANIVLRDKYGLNVKAMNPDFEIYEIQAKTCAEVAGFSARYAADKLGKPCLKSDTGLYIDALGGLPGPYNAYFDKQIGVEKFLKMFKDEKNRKARLEHCFAYCEPGKDPVIFTGECTGTISKEARGGDGRWHDFFFIPDGETKTLAEIGDESPEKKASHYGTAIDDLAKWLKERK